MFEVINKENNKKYKVYNIRYEDTETYFLIFENDEWYWGYACDYRPVTM